MSERWSIEISISSLTVAIWMLMGRSHAQQDGETYSAFDPAYQS